VKMEGVPWHRMEQHSTLVPRITDICIYVTRVPTLNLSYVVCVYCYRWLHDHPDVQKMYQFYHLFYNGEQWVGTLQGVPCSYTFLNSTCTPNSKVLPIYIVLTVMGHFLTGYAFEQVRNDTSVVKLIKCYFLTNANVVKEFLLSS
jgi:hypothetical protein